MERLTEEKRYEDTCLETEEVLTGKELAEAVCAMNMLREYQALGPIDHLRELAQAKKDGRLVVLPCRTDESVYQWKKGDDIPSLFRFYGVNINENGEIAYQTHWGETFSPDDFGRSIFLTREEAEAALKKREEEDSETVR